MIKRLLFMFSFLEPIRLMYSVIKLNVLSEIPKQTTSGPVLLMLKVYKGVIRYYKGVLHGDELMT